MGDKKENQGKENERVSIAFLARKTRGQSQAVFAKSVGISRSTQARRERRGQRLDPSESGDRLYRLILACHSIGAAGLVDQALDYAEDKGEEKSFFRLAIRLIESGRGALVGRILRGGEVVTEEEAGEMKIEDALSLAEAVSTSLRREAEDADDETLKHIALSMEGDALQLKAWLAKRAEGQAAHGGEEDSE